MIILGPEHAVEVWRQMLTIKTQVHDWACHNDVEFFADIEYIATATDEDRYIAFWTTLKQTPEVISIRCIPEQRSIRFVLAEALQPYEAGTLQKTGVKISMILGTQEDRAAFR